MQNSLRVLSIDGGGTRGLMPAALLYCIEQETAKKNAIHPYGGTY